MSSVKLISVAPGINRSKLFATAIEEFVTRHDGGMITRKIDEVYEKIDKAEFEPQLGACLESLRDVTKHDAW
jgi:hypothetical protein